MNVTAFTKLKKIYSPTLKTQFFYLIRNCFVGNRYIKSKNENNLYSPIALKENWERFWTVFCNLKDGLTFSWGRASKCIAQMMALLGSTLLLLPFRPHARWLTEVWRIVHLINNWAQENIIFMLNNMIHLYILCILLCTFYFPVPIILLMNNLDQSPSC